MTFPKAILANPSSLQSPTEISEDRGYQLRISSEFADPAWDTFLSETSGGQYVQSSLWAQVKAINGWRVERVTVTQQGRIVAGAQLLLRPLPAIGAVGYLPRGPIFAVADPTLTNLVMNALLDSAKRCRCQIMLVQPPGNGERLAAQLPDWNFRPSSKIVAPAYTLLLDLRQKVEAILKRMNRQTRYNTRLGPRRGLVIREGTKDDLPAFYRLLTMTGQRQNFDVSSEEYYANMWQAFGSGDHIALFLAEYEGEVVSAQLAIAFGNTVINKMTAWSGLYGNLKPNEALMWAAIQWAKAQSRDYYDFGGMSSKIANALLLGEPLTERMKASVSSFKLGFGGEVFVYPKAYMYVGNPMLRWFHAKWAPAFENSKASKRIFHRFRTQ